MVAEASTEGPIQAASAVGRMASGVEHAREGNSGERATLNHRQGLCVRSRVTGAGRRVRRGGAGSQGAFMNVCIGVQIGHRQTAASALVVVSCTSPFGQNRTFS